MPGGALVDAARSERLVAGIAIGAICFSALAYAAMPIFPMVLSAAVVHSLASCVLGPAIAAISLGLVGHAAISERLGRNARFASIGNGLAAAVMAGVGYFSPRGVFIVTVCLLIPAVLALRSIAAGEIDPERAHGAASRRVRKPPTKPGELMHNRPLLIFAGCLLLFHLGQRGDVAAGGQRRHHALSALGDNVDRRLHCRPPARGRGRSRRGSAGARRFGAAGRCC